MTIYISGKMTGVENYNKEKFDNAEKLLEEKGHTVVNPHALSEIVFSLFAIRSEEPSRYDFMRVDIQAMAKCDAILMLDDWGYSWGAGWEHKIAQEVFNLRIYYDINDIESCKK